MTRDQTLRVAPVDHVADLAPSLQHALDGTPRAGELRLERLRRDERADLLEIAVFDRLQHCGSLVSDPAATSPADRGAKQKKTPRFLSGHRGLFVELV